MQSSPGTTTTTGSRSCAACKFQRRRCKPNCPLAPYFPADNPTQFTNAHRLFGVHKIIKTLKKVKPEQQADAMKSLIFTANAHAMDPVGGCYRIIQDLRQQIAQTQAELDAVTACIAAGRAQIGSGLGSGSGVGDCQEVVDVMENVVPTSSSAIVVPQVEVGDGLDLEVNEVKPFLHS